MFKDVRREHDVDALVRHRDRASVVLPNRVVSSVLFRAVRNVQSGHLAAARRQKARLVAGPCAELQNVAPRLEPTGDKVELGTA